MLWLWTWSTSTDVHWLLFFFFFFRKKRPCHFETFPFLICTEICSPCCYAVTFECTLFACLLQSRPASCLCFHSAGVGRTGTFIVIDSMIDMMHVEQRVDVFGFVSRIREQRCQLIQTDVRTDPLWPVVCEADSSARRSGPSKNKQTLGKQSRLCGEILFQTRTTSSLSSIASFFSSSDAVLLHLPGTPGVLSLWGHRARCVFSGGSPAQAS